MTALLSSQQRRAIRDEIRKKRRNLTALEQIGAAHRVAEQAFRLIERRQAQCVAVYLSFDGEISTEPLIQQLWRQNIQVCLPVLHPFSAGNLLFLHYEPETLMKKNKFGIIEPVLDVRKVVPITQLDIIFTPLVAFDANGNRLGMGGGFYDRTLCGWREKSFIPVGLAHQCQQVESLPTENWDIPLERILIG
ncbi:5-formyltetrahydrofolate cyclo-ligase [Caviibacterium pharyngocola]|uniref:5-formyltetrahydrofolate cyclo-ligase n=1 Tax=Caviibacterium pharyngocola TaxID=28159 RepID=A0A2M8RWF3_9PAST|nr:5-formyltetrahydrofolate cyclo-ligase [Caviibacterium pharyngocola]PJG83201.1 5-formyltetrahydrofolate cyclo-ligase [Caviibacterium pharyngocola]